MSIYNWSERSWFIIKYDELKNISTESVNKNTENIDKLPTLEVIKLINEEDKKVADAVLEQAENISLAVEETVKALRNGGRVVYIGAGTSGRIGITDSAEMTPTYNVPTGIFIGIIAGGEKAIRNAIENIEDSREASIEDLKEINFNEKDILIGLTASGRTPYVLSAIEYAKEVNAKTISISTSVNSQSGEAADIKIEPFTGAEVISGSTRMKSGTAQKMVLNMISTATMVKMGKVYGNLMVDVDPTNEKLQNRAKFIIKQITKIEDDELITDALSEADNSVKVAVVILVKNVGSEQARKILSENDNNLSEVI